jgi:hypothetical protein
MGSESPSQGRVIDAGQLYVLCIVDATREVTSMCDDHMAVANAVND